MVNRLWLMRGYVMWAIQTMNERTGNGVVLMEVFNKMKSISISEMLELSDTIFPLLTTDLSNTDLIGYGGFHFEDGWI